MKVFAGCWKLATVSGAIPERVRFRAAYFSSPPIRHYRFGSTPPIPSRATLNYSDYIIRSVHAEQDLRRPIPG